MLAQLRLAWWRDKLSTSSRQWPVAEPLFAALAPWREQSDALVSLVNGWEQMVGETPLPREAFEHLAEARGAAFAGLCSVTDCPDASAAAHTSAMDWSLVDTLSRLSGAEERDAVAALLAGREMQHRPLPKALRPLAILRGLAVQSVRRGVALDELGMRGLAAALRIGLAGR
jgi:phytoene synthase